MSDDITGQSVLFSDRFCKPLAARFDERHGSCDGGAVLLRACDRKHQFSFGRGYRFGRNRMRDWGIALA